MKRVLSALFVLLTAHSGFAQICNATFNTAIAAQNNNLLRLQLNNTSTPAAGVNKYTQFGVFWGDGAYTNAWTGSNYHNYASPGKYNVGLVMNVYDSTTTGFNWVCADTTWDSVNVQYSACASAFTTTASGLTVTVTATTPGSTSGTSYSWNWGDGSPASSGSPASHTYTTAGSKTITLTATNGTCVYTNTQTFTATPGINCGNANASFTSGGTNPVTFNSTSTNISGTTKKYSWYFGDGNTLLNTTNGSPTHAYSVPGVYTVLLETYWIDSIGGTSVKCYDSVANVITVANTISGYIGLDSNSTGTFIDSPHYKVWLIVFDSATNILSAVDSTTVWGTNYWSTPYQFNGHAAGTYRVKAQLLNGPTSGPSWAPTYHMNSLMWNTATTFYHNGGATAGKWINMQTGTATSGPGFVGGNVSAGANKGTGNNGIEGLNIFLLDANGTLVAHAVTDVNGNYSFSQLPPATYSVYPEHMGLSTTPINVSVVAGKPNVTGIDFERSLANKTITPKSLAVANVNASFITTIYPNPAKDKISVHIGNLNGDNATIIIADVTGKTVRSVNTNNAVTEIALSDLQKGLYLITVSADNMQQTMKMLLQ